MRIQNELRVSSHSWLMIILLAAFFSKSAPAQVPAELCGPMSLPMQFGPYDYRTDKDKLSIVEIAHFTPRVESLIHGESTVSFAADISYTLQRFPNHHRALVSVLRMVERKMPAVSELLRPPECFFERAVRWRKDDVVARMLYAKFLFNQNRKSDAISQLEITEKYSLDNPFTHRNIGLLLIEMNEFSRALLQAHKLLIIDPNYTRLRDALTAEGQWRDPEAALPTGTGPAASASAPVYAAPAK